MGLVSMGEQLDMFTMLGMDKTPMIPFEEQKKGRKGWIIEISGIFLVKNGFKENKIGVRTHAIEFIEDSKKDKYGRIIQYARKIKPHDGGWFGPYKDVYATRPTLEECIAFGKSKYSVPAKVVYFERDGHDRSIWEYDEGNRKL